MFVGAGAAVALSAVGGFVAVAIAVAGVGVGVAGDAPHAVSITHSARVSRNSRNRTVARLYGGNKGQTHLRPARSRRRTTGAYPTG